MNSVNSICILHTLSYGGDGYYYYSSRQIFPQTYQLKYDAESDKYYVSLTFPRTITHKQFQDLLQGNQVILYDKNGLQYYQTQKYSTETAFVSLPEYESAIDFSYKRYIIDKNSFDENEPQKVFIRKDFTNIIVGEGLSAYKIQGTSTLSTWEVGLSSSVQNKLKYQSNRNILDNWYFGNPVNQRDGLLCLANTTLYADSALTQVRGPSSTINAIMPTYTSDTAIGWVGSDGLTYYAAASDIVHGYIGATYGIDRWYNAAGMLKVNENYNIEISNVNTGACMLQQVDNPKQYAGLQLTVSALVRSTGTSSYITIRQDGQYSNDLNITIPQSTSQISLISKTFTVSNTLTNDLAVVLASWDSTQLIDIYAIKLEVGPKQTLAHTTLAGLYELNEIPDYEEQLAKCQHYFVRLSDGYADNGDICGVGYSSNPNEVRVMVPLPCTMRSKPVVTCNNIVENTGGLLSFSYGGWNTKRSNLLTLVFNSVNSTNTNVVRYGGNGYIDVSADL